MMNQASITQYSDLSKAREALVELILRMSILFVKYSELKRKLGSILNNPHLPNRAKSALCLQYLFDLL